MGGGDYKFSHVLVNQRWFRADQSEVWSLGEDVPKSFRVTLHAGAPRGLASSVRSDFFEKKLANSRHCVHSNDNEITRYRR